MALPTSLAANRRATTQFPATVRQQLTALERQLGGRAALVGLLALAPLTPDLQYVLGLLGDPKHDAASLADICAQGAILPSELLQQLAAAALLQGKVLAQQKIGAGIAAVAEDVMRRAAPYEERCHACAGTGTVTPDPSKDEPNPRPGPCETCAGCGKLRYQPELDRQKLAIEMAQLLPKSAGINIAMQQVNGASAPAAGSGIYDALQEVTDALYGPPGATPLAVDAELVENPAPVDLPLPGEA